MFAYFSLSDYDRSNGLLAFEPIRLDRPWNSYQRYFPLNHSSSQAMTTFLTSNLVRNFSMTLQFQKALFSMLLISVGMLHLAAVLPAQEQLLEGLEIEKRFNPATGKLPNS